MVSVLDGSLHMLFVCIRYGLDVASQKRDGHARRFINGCVDEHHHKKKKKPYSCACAHATDPLNETIIKAKNNSQEQ